LKKLVFPGGGFYYPLKCLRRQSPCPAAMMQPQDLSTMTQFFNAFPGADFQKTEAGGTPKERQ